MTALAALTNDELADRASCPVTPAAWEAIEREIERRVEAGTHLDAAGEPMWTLVEVDPDCWLLATGRHTHLDRYHTSDGLDCHPWSDPA